MSALTRTASAAELAQALGLSKRAIARRAAAEGWAFEETTTRGGTTRCYTVQTLPAALRAKLVWQPQPSTSTPADRAAARAAAQAGQAEATAQALATTLQAAATAQRGQVALRQAGELGAAAQARMDARLAVVRAADLFATQAGRSLAADQALMLFAGHYNAGTTPVPAGVRELLPTVSARSIRRWQAEVRASGITALAGAYGNRAGSSKLDTQPELRAFVQGMLVTHPHARATHVMKGLQARFEAGANMPGHALPSMRALERWMAEWRSANAEVLQALENPDAWKNKYMAAFGSKSEGVDHINALWERDSSPFDVMCADGRYCVIGGVDVYTRSAKLLVAKTSKAVAVGAHLRAMLLDFGVPDTDKTDNGSDYTALYTERVYQGLSIQHDLCPPFQPWHKPHVERFFGTFTRDLVELLPGYIGHSVAERNAIEARTSFADRLMKRDRKEDKLLQMQMTGAELQAFADNWLASVYDHAPHEGLGQRTPFELRAAHAADVRRIADLHALDVLLAEAPGNDGKRTVQKKGVKLDHGYFIAPELAGWIGQDVQVRYDPLHHDLGTVHVFSADGLQFICMAQNPDRTGMDRREVAVQAKAMQRDRVQAERKALKAAAKKVGIDQVVGEILRTRAAATGKLTVLPTRQATHTSPGLQAAGAAARAATAAQRTTADSDITDLAEAQAARLRLAAQAKAATAAAGPVAMLPAALGPQPTPVFESPAQRVQWLLLQQAMRELGAEEQDALARFRREQPASYRRLQALADEAKAAGKENSPVRIAGDTGLD